MAKTAAISGDIVHSVAVRYRARGSGSLRTRLYNMGEITAEANSLKLQNLEPISLAFKSNREKTVLSNFQDQGIQIYFRTVAIDDVFTISKITLFVKPVAEGYPIKSNSL